MILDANGREVEKTEPGCPACGRTNTKVRQASFGGYWKDVCKGCGHVIAHGREVMPLMR